jgi:hypothetical protein
VVPDLERSVTRDGYWLRYVIESPLPEVGEPYAQVWFARQSASDPARSFGINRRYPITSLVTGRDPFAVAIGPSRLGHDHAKGAVSGDGHAVEWDLSWRPGVATLFQLPAVMYRAAASARPPCSRPTSTCRSPAR